MPELVASMDNKPKQVVFVGNTNEKHVETMLKYGKDNPEQCWMAYLGYSEDRVEAFANYVLHMSLHFKEEANKFGFRYVELSDDHFEESLQEAINTLKK